MLEADLATWLSPRRRAQGGYRCGLCCYVLAIVVDIHTAHLHHESLTNLSNVRSDRGPGKDPLGAGVTANYAKGPALERVFALLVEVMTA